MKKIINKNLLSYLAVTVSVIVFLYLARIMFIDSYNISSTSMTPNLKAHDKILVNHAAFGVKIPFLNLHLFRKYNLKRGDIVVFMDPRGSKRKFIKRIMALPGDKIKLTGQRIFINDKELKKIPVKDFYYDEKGVTIHSVLNVEENLSGQKYYIVLDKKQTLRYIVKAFYCNKEFIVPKDNFFAIGDNRDGSTDSRHFGFIPFSKLIGRPIFIIYSKERGKIHFKRTGKFKNQPI